MGAFLMLFTLVSSNPDVGLLSPEAISYHSWSCGDRIDLETKEFHAICAKLIDSRCVENGKIDLDLGADDLDCQTDAENL